MVELERLYEATVGEDEIDHLGHMNVRFYFEKALRASHALASEYDLSPDACRELGAVLEVRDNFARHYREQLAGAKLVVMGGVIGADSDRLRFYHELINPEREERAATFVHELGLRHRETGAALPLPSPIAKSAGESFVEWPEHGRPRTHDLDRVSKISLDLARERKLATRKVRVLGAEECDEAGFFLSPNYQSLVWGGEPLERQTSDLPLHDMQDGGKFGWAALESRVVMLELPRVGTRVQSFGAEVGLASKTSLRQMWVFDIDRGELLCSCSIVNLAFDIEARRAIEIPAAIRETLERDYHPDLR